MGGRRARFSSPACSESGDQTSVPAQPRMSETPLLRSALVPAADAASLAPEWEALCGELLEENPFFAPGALIPALKAYGDDRVRLACVWSGDALIALTPVAAKRFYAKLPVAYWATWTHPHCYYGAPLIRRGFEEEALDGLFALLCDGAEGRAFLRLARLDRDGAVLKAAQAAALRRNRVAYDAGAIARAALQAGASAEATLAVHVRKKKRKELARLRKRLEERGEVSLRLLSIEDDLRQWTEDFLALEDKSWKGAEGTSLKSDKRDAAWFRETLAGMDKKARLHFLRLDLDGKAIAMLATLIADGAAYSMKICHDPEYGRYSPGVMIEIEAMRSLLTRPDFRFADSCAAPDHAMINGLWRARRVITGLNVSGAGAAARGTLALARLLEGARARLPRIETRERARP
jgi:CelD/BcsL family acetyltransferase involved in cellulose biosynthesis